MEIPGRLLALVLFVAAIPLLGVLMALVRLTSAGPAIYRQQRVGKNGRVFWIYKLRTMRQNVEAATGAVWSPKIDSRVTLVGNVLRRLHLDEFPQLWNVLRGEMALVGPRPERPEFVQKLTRHVPGYLQRLAVKPGITGLAQVNLPPDTDYTSVKRKLVLDLEYIERATLSLDIKIILCTSLRLLFIHGVVTRRLVGIDHFPRLDEEVECESPTAMADEVIPATTSHLLFTDGSTCPIPD